MSGVMAPKSTAPFYVAFRRYAILTSTSQRHIHLPPRSSQSLPHPLHRTPSFPRRHATTSASPSTGSISPQRSPDKPIFYDLFPKTLPHGPPPEGPFIINARTLRSEFLQLQARAHPDRHSGPDKARAEGTSALINSAYRTLLDPLKRAQYLLQLRGIDVAEDERLKVEDPELLMEVLEVRETIEAAQDEGELGPLKEKNEENVRRSEGVLDQAFRRDDVQTAMDEAVKLRYWINIRESLDAWEKGKPVVLVH